MKRVLKCRDCHKSVRATQEKHRERQGLCASCQRSYRRIARGLSKVVY